MTNYLNVPGAQLTKDEREKIKEFAASVDKPEPVMVNIGIMWGATMWCLREGAPKGQLYGIDLCPNKWQIVDRKKLNARIIEGDSRLVHQSFNKKIDVLLIDGDHHYNVVKADIENWVQKCKGIVMFHDYEPTQFNLKQFPELEGVKRAVDEYFKDKHQWIGFPAVDSLKAFKCVK